MPAINIAKAWLPINCFYNYKIETNGKCYCSLCMMNEVPELKEKIKQNGCGCFNMTKVIAKAEIAAREINKSR